VASYDHRIAGDVGFWSQPEIASYDNAVAVDLAINFRISSDNNDVAVQDLVPVYLDIAEDPDHVVFPPASPRPRLPSGRGRRNLRRVWISVDLKERLPFRRCEIRKVENQVRVGAKPGA